jgi:hypothetical protein
MERLERRAHHFHVVWDRDLPLDREYLALQCDDAPVGKGLHVRA